ncbi:right-handed parallel beta-helix repeat-containing protein [Mesobacillus thioparans]|uniref:right-handed parallel beta-helix repeat-containing protein n=1 Tax=Mesobacillus thioparans TaxID=370439 RepID=UPI0039F01B1B
MKSVIKLLSVLLLLLSLTAPEVAEASSKTYTITAKSKPYKGNMMNYSTYNKYTKQYYLIRSYLERLEKTGGGKLVLKKGTYTIPTTLYVPSNVTIVLKNGVKIVKGNKTGSGKIKTTNTIFQLIRPSHAPKKGIKGGYKGEKNITFIGEGKAVIDLKYSKDTIAIVAGHNKNVKVENITFQNMNSGHFIEVDATDKMVIKNNKFLNSKPSPGKNKEAVNLDTPDKVTKGWGHAWSKYDKTPNRDIFIETNSFKNLDRAIGTHKYSEGKYHDKVIIRYNNIEKTRQDAIRVMNWSNAVIEHNVIKNVAGRAGTYRGIFASGAINPEFRHNTIENASRPIVFMPWKNIGTGSSYKTTYNQISDQNIESLKTNSVKDVNEDFIRINYEYNVFDHSTLKLSLTK